MARLLEPFAGDLAECVADRLICRFGSLGRALIASPEQLRRVLEGDTELADLLVAARSLFRAGLQEEIARTPVSIADPAYQEYLHLLLGKCSTEMLHATFVSHDAGYLADEMLARGSLKRVDIDLRTMLGRAFELGAHGIILAHNHPSQSAEPSDEDVAVTRRIADLLTTVGIALVDHLIVGGNRIVSLRARGFL